MSPPPPPIEGAALNLEEERPPRGWCGGRGDASGPGNDWRVGRQPETRPHVSGVLAVAVLRKVLEVGSSQEVPGRAGLRNESWISQPRAPIARETRGQDPELFIERAFRDTLRNPGSSDLWLSGEAVGLQSPLQAEPRRLPGNWKRGSAQTHNEKKCVTVKETHSKSHVFRLQCSRKHAH